MAMLPFVGTALPFMEAVAAVLTFTAAGAAPVPRAFRCGRLGCPHDVDCFPSRGNGHSAASNGLSGVVCTGQVEKNEFIQEYTGEQMSQVQVLSPYAPPTPSPVPRTSVYLRCVQYRRCVSSYAAATEWLVVMWHMVLPGGG
eukprot:3362118-Rhodomonas_salina.1